MKISFKNKRRIVKSKIILLPITINLLKFTVFTLVSLTIIASPYILTRPAKHYYFDFSNTGQVGDTIGGITAPIINLIGAILVYLSFKKQIEANNLQKQALDNEIKQNLIRNQQETLDKHYFEFKSEFEKVKYKKKTITPTYLTKEVLLSGEEAIEGYAEDIDKNSRYNSTERYQLEYHLTFVNLLIESFIEELNKSNLNYRSKKYLFQKFFYYYCSKLEFGFGQIQKEAQKVSDSEDEELDDFDAILLEVTNIINLIEESADYYDLQSPNN